MGEDFRRLKAWRATELRRDARLTPAARLVGLELLAWWSEKHPRGPIYGRTNEKLTEALGLSRAMVKNAKAQLRRFEYFRFRHTGRADLAWPTSLEAEQRWLNFGPQTAEIHAGREAKSSPRINQQTSTNQNEGSRSSQFSGSGRQTAQTEQQLREAFGEDGQDILSALYAIDRGRPYWSLIARAEQGTIGEQEINEARLIAMQARARAIGE